MSSHSTSHHSTTFIFHLFSFALWFVDIAPNIAAVPHFLSAKYLVNTLGDTGPFAFLGDEENEGVDRDSSWFNILQTALSFAGPFCAVIGWFLRCCLRAKKPVSSFLPDKSEEIRFPYFVPVYGIQYSRRIIYFNLENGTPIYTIDAWCLVKMCFRIKFCIHIRIWVFSFSSQVSEFIDPRFRENKPKTLVFSHRKRAYWLVFAKTVSIISGKDRVS
jgi:hypothetical protein